MTECRPAGNAGLAQALKAALEQRKPWMLTSLAREFSVTEKQVAEALPEDMCAFAPGSSFIKVWESLATWESATFIVQHEGHVLEIQGRIPAGTPGHGYYNLADGEALGGHIRADAVADMAFLSMPFMGLESHSVQFFDAHGHVAFSVYAGRENHRIIPSVREAFFRLRGETAVRCAGESRSAEPGK